MRLGVYGGSFDPIHLGHLLLAESAYRQMRLDRIDFIPRSDSWRPKHRFPITGEDRYQMTLRAVAPYPEFAVSRYELDTPGALYSADTLQYYRDAYPDDEVFFIVSSETFNDLPLWHSPERVCQLASIIIAQRCGYPPPNFDALRNFLPSDKIEGFRRQVVEMPQVEISSSSIRQRVSTGESVRFMVPDAVAEYIQEKNLYANR